MDGLLRPKVFRFLIHFFPAYRGTGGRVEHISADWMHWRIRLPLNIRTRNYVGTIFGGSLYAAVDPILMLAFIQILGKEYVVWDKAATIRFRRPGRSTLFADIRITPEEVEEVKRLCAANAKVERTYTIELKDEAGIVHCSVEKLLHFRLRGPEAHGA
jgi:acyl-coenzyme A thioesterase PaaI-like protein